MSILSKVDNAIEIAKGATYSLTGSSLFATLTLERASASILATMSIASGVMTWYLSRIRERREHDRRQRFDDFMSRLDRIMAVSAAEKQAGPLGLEALRGLIQEELGNAASKPVDSPLPKTA